MKYTHILATLMCSLFLGLFEKLIAMEGQNQDEPRQEESEDKTAINLGKKLLDALERKNKEEALSILALGPDITITNQDGFQSIHLAAQNGFADIIAVLVERGASVDAVANNQNQDRPIFLAARGCYCDALAFLLAHGADVNAEAGIPTKDDNGRMIDPYTVISFACSRVLKTLKYAEEAALMKKMLKVLHKNGSSFDEMSFGICITRIVGTASDLFSKSDPQRLMHMHNFLSSFLKSLQLFSNNLRIGILDVLSLFYKIQFTYFGVPTHEKLALLFCFLSHNLLSILPSRKNISKFWITVQNPENSNEPLVVEILLGWITDLALFDLSATFVSRPETPWFLDTMHSKLMLELAASRGSPSTLQKIVANSATPVNQEMFSSAFLCATGSNRPENAQWLLANADMRHNRELWLNTLEEGLHLAVQQANVDLVGLILQVALWCTVDIELSVKDLGRKLYNSERQRPNGDHRRIRVLLRDYLVERLRMQHLNEIILENQQIQEPQETETTLVGAFPHPRQFSELPQEIRDLIHQFTGLPRDLAPHSPMDSKSF